MCARYELYSSPDRFQELEQIINDLNRKKHPDTLKTRGEVFPTDVVPVLANNRQLVMEPFAMQWGYSFPGGRPVINARSETAAEKPLFQDGMQQRRCLIPAAYYYEWRHTGPRTKMALGLQDDSLLYLAGIYHLENHGGVIVPAFTILTREAAPDIRFIHDRMPVILPASMKEDWLNPACNAVDMLQAARGDTRCWEAASVR